MIPKIYVALTFDDGYIYHYAVAQLLNRLGIKATFFIITHLKKFEGKTLLTLRPELIGEIVKYGHEIGSHTKTHPNLTTIPLYKVEEEARESKRLLEDLTGKEIINFAYPYGAYNTNTIRVISRYYEYARGGGVNSLEDSFNVNPKSRYIIGAFVRQRKYIRKLLQLPIKLIQHEYRECIRIVIVMHMEGMFEILALITYLKLLPANVRFITMTELAETLRSE